MARTSDWSIKRFWIKMFRHTLKGVKVVTSYAVPTLRKLWFPFIGKPFVLKPPFLSIFQSITVQSPSLDLICQRKLTLFSRESSKVVIKRDQHPWATLEKSCETTRRDHWEVVCYWGIISDQWWYISLTNPVRGLYCKLWTEGEKRGFLTYSTHWQSDVTLKYCLLIWLSRAHVLSERYSECI